MRIKYCRKYEKYVSQQHCEFFNEGKHCGYYSAKTWHSIKELTGDQDRPKWNVNEIIKPYKCDMLDREHLNRLSLKRRVKKRAGSALA
ncbi:MAG: hypothetical protein ACLGPL_06385 [Acidobacteriota bacterium]